MLLNKLLKILFVISLILLIITLSFKLFLFNFDLYKKEFAKNNIYEKIPDADENALNLINFMNNKEELNDFYNENEKLHLQDVKDLYKNLNLVFYITLILTILFLIYFIYARNYKILSNSLLISSMILFIVVLTFFIFDFNYLFEKFHIIIFNNDLWKLNPVKDNLINLFPEQIQYNIAKRILLIILILGIIQLILSLIVKLKNKQKVFK